MLLKPFILKTIDHEKSSFNSHDIFISCFGKYRLLGNTITLNEHINNLKK